MRGRMFIVVVVVLLVAMTVNVWSQGRGQGWAASQTSGNTASQNVVSVTGTVTSVNMAPGQGMPSITINTGSNVVTVLLGPYRVIMNNKLEFVPGQTVTVKAFQDPRFSDAWVATEVTVNGTTVLLRDAAGMPHSGYGAMQQHGGMMARGQGTGMGMMRGGARGLMSGGVGMQADCPYNASKLDLMAKTELTGTVVGVSMGVGQGAASFTLNVGGRNVAIVAAPYHLLLEAGFTISVTDALSVTAYPVAGVADTYAAAVLNNPKTGKIIQLRDDSGTVLGMQGYCPMKVDCPCKK